MFAATRSSSTPVRFRSMHWVTMLTGHSLLEAFPTAESLCGLAPKRIFPKAGRYATVTMGRPICAIDSLLGAGGLLGAGSFGGGASNVEITGTMSPGGEHTHDRY